jgi:fibronectin-binding autotransporter adhesin
VAKLRSLFESIRRALIRPRRRKQHALCGEEFEARIVPASIWWLGTAGNNWNSDSWTNVDGGAAVMGLRPDSITYDDLQFDTTQANYKTTSQMIVNDMLGLSNLSISIKDDKPVQLSLSGNAIGLGSGGIDVETDLNQNTFTLGAREWIKMPLILDASQTWTIDMPTEIDGIVSGGAGDTLTTAGVDALTVTGANTFDAAVDVSQGIFIAANPTALGTTVGATTVVAGAQLDVCISVSTGTPITIAGESLSLAGIGDANTFLSVNGGDTKNNTWTGPITLSGNPAGMSALEASITISGVISGPIGDAFVVQNLNPNGFQTVLTGPNTYQGPTEILAGQAVVTSLNSVASAGGAVLASSSLGAPTDAADAVIDLGAPSLSPTFQTPPTPQLKYVGPGESTNRGLSILGSTVGAILNSFGTGRLEFTGTITVPGVAGSDNRKTLTITGSENGEIDSPIPDSATGIAGELATSLNMTGVGTWLLLGDNTYSGSTTVGGGVLQFGNGGVTGSPGSGPLLIGSGSQLTVDRSDTVTIPGAISGSGIFAQIGSGTTILTGNGSFSGSASILSGILQLGNGATSGAFAAGTGVITDNATLVVDRSDVSGLSSPIAGSGAFLQMGPGTTILTGASTYGGGTTIAAGTLQIGSGGTTGSLKAGSTIFDQGTLTVDRSDTVTLDYAITGNGGLAQVGPGTLVLAAGAASYSGPTSVSGGTLTGAGAPSSIVSVAESGILTGNGIYAGIVGGGIAGTGYSGVIDPGTTASAGILTTGSLVGNAVFPFDFEITGKTTPGVDFDQIDVAGAVTLANPTLNITETGLSVGDAVTLIRGATSLTGNFVGLPEGATFRVGADWLRITYAGGSGHDVVVAKVAAPAALYVSGTWSGDGSGTPVTDPTLTGGTPASFGTNAFATIGDAVRQAALVGAQIIVVNPGNYGGEDLSVTQSDDFQLQGGSITIGSLVSGSDVSIAIPTGSALTLGDATDFTLTATLFGGGNFSKVGTDTITIGSLNALIGPTTVSGGDLVLDTDASGPGRVSAGLGTSIVTVNAPAHLDINLIDTSAPVIFSADGAFGGLAGTGTFNFNYLNTTSALDSSVLGLNDGFLAGSVINLNQTPGGSSRLRDVGTGFMHVLGDIGHAAVNITEGAQLYTDGVDIGSSTMVNALTLSGDGYAESDGSHYGALRLGFSSTWTGQVTLAGGAQISGPGFLSFFTSPIVGTGDLILGSDSSVPGTIYLTRTNTYAGGTTIDPDATVVLRSGTFGIGGLVNFGNLELDQATTSLPDLSGAGAVGGVSSTSALLTVGSSNASTTFDGALTDGASGSFLSFAKTGSGTLTLTNPGSSWFGTTILSAGTLRLTTTARIGLNFIEEGNGTLAFDLSGTQSGQIVANGGYLTGMSLGLNIVGNVADGQSFTLMSFFGNQGNVGGTFANLPASGSTMVVGGRQYSINYTGGDGNDVVVTALPSGLGLFGSPVLNGGASYVNSTLAGNQHSIVESVVFSFSQAVTLSAAEFTLTGINGTTFAPTVNVSAANGTTSNSIWTVTFSGDGVNNTTHSIGDGEYQLVFDGLGLTSTFDFFRLLGDMDGNGTVDSSDFNILISSFLRGTADPAYLGADDLDGNNKVDGSDFNIFVSNYLKVLPNTTVLH